MTNIKAKLEQIFEFITQLNLLLDEEEYESFQQQQELFGDQLKDFIHRYSEEQLNTVIEPLKRLQHQIQLLQDRSDTESKKLKEKSLLMQRNKKKINAYK